MPISAGSSPAVPLSAATAVVGVIGDPVAHSLSPLLHNTAFAELGLDWVSVGFRVAAGHAGEAMTGAEALGIRGLSVTMPHKDAVAALVERRSALAERLGAVNCVVLGAGPSWGDSTDGPGLVAALRRGDHFDPDGRRCLVVGAGGAARAVIVGLADAGAGEVVVVNRSADRGARAAALGGPVGRVGEPGDATRCDLVVNATPLGMGANREAERPEWPIDPALLVKGQCVVDLVYDPPVSPWLAAARRRGADTSNGLGMLVHQAALQVGLWTGQDPPVEAMWRAVSGPGSAEAPS
jgi:shikimate dehydrogenase